MDAATLVSRIGGVDQGRFRSKHLGLACYALALALPLWAGYRFWQSHRELAAEAVQLYRDAADSINVGEAQSETDRYLRSVTARREQDETLSAYALRREELNQGFRFLLLYMVLPLCGLSIYIGKRLRSRSAAEVLRSDPRLPILYLRSFKFDGIANAGKLNFTTRTEEEDLVRAFRSIGPVIAIGDPSEKIPEVGAARVYVSHEKWQERALDMMAAARIVVLRAGLTKGIFWEMDRVRKNVAPRKVLLFVPFIADRRRYQEFCDGIGGTFGVLLSKHECSRFIAFDEDWNPSGVGPAAGRIGMELEPLIRKLEAAGMKDLEKSSA